MKLKPVNIVEIVLAIVAVISHFLIKTHIPFMALLSVLNITILSMLYFYGGVFVLASPGIAKPVLIIYGLAFGTAMIGLLFYIQKWPYANIEMGFATGVFLILALVRVVAVYMLKKNNVLPYSKGIAIRYILFFVAMLCAFLI